ncbi:MFS transporter [Bacteriovorax sp. PP10]|uniref:MFS transporter n=1 Tax=Bacteriovorax antarcticus TaxID=3088717 RepID=A0ABU5VRV1_9BACT|nr:MFS transporter [Bacteriovorax sp. PP10]MEA9355773.1 MFS transporter [Bacteriovorax sp. PP10]
MFANKKSLYVLCAASGVCSLIMLDTNVVAVSLPAISKALGASFRDLEWVISSYILTFAIFLMPAGAISDNYGRKRSVMLGLVFFLLASLVCGFAPTVTILNIGRAAKGIGAAFLLIGSLAIIGKEFSDPRERAKAWGIWGSTLGLTITLSPVIGGIITTYLGWRWAFFINVPAVLILLAAINHYVTESSDPDADKLDIPGLITFTFALFFLSWFLIDASEVKITTPTMLLRLLGGLIFFGLFIYAEKKQKRGMLDLSLFKNKFFIGSVCSMLAYALSAQVMMNYIPLYLQNVFSLTPLAAGLHMLPFAIAMIIFPKFSLYLNEKFTQGQVLAIGLLTVSIGDLLGFFLVTSNSYPLVACALIIMGAGAGMLNGETTKAIMGSVPFNRSGMASGISTTTRFTGILFGVSGLGGILSIVTNASFNFELKKNQIRTPINPEFIKSILSGDLPKAMTKIDMNTQKDLLESGLRAFSNGFSTVLLTGSVISFCFAIVIYILMNPKKR